MTVKISSADLYKTYKKEFRKIADVKYASAVLQWDQETYLPKQGGELRGQQLATLSELAHEMFTADKVGELLQTLADRDDLSVEEKKNVTLSLEDYNKLKKFSPEFVRTMSETVSASFHSWIAARNDNDFRLFEPLLTKIVELKRQEADMLGYADHPYDALMDEYEKGATVKLIDKIFAEVEGPLKELLAELESKPSPANDFLHQHFPKDKQWEWSLYLAKQLGFDFNAGRQDISEHPFTTNFSNRDVRITTRIDENDFSNMTWSTIHEVGHALYEQGLPGEQYGLPLGEYTSLGIHESQSRLWENCIGRGTDFWHFYFPKLQEYFPSQFASVSLHQFLSGINKVKPSLIRTEADELTYHFHIMIRYELEKNLIGGSLQVKDVPSYWNEQYKKLLGVDVPDNKRGCLQDVHWSHGSFGYFATYSLGSFYAAQFWQQANHDIPTLKQNIRKQGDTQLLLDWLRSKIHLHGKLYTSEELCTLATGKGLDSSVFVNYLRQKFAEVL